jgi:hypothetical protein
MALARTQARGARGSTTAAAAPDERPFLSALYAEHYPPAASPALDRKVARSAG